MSTKLLKTVITAAFIFVFSITNFAQGDKAQVEMYEKWIAIYKAQTPEQQTAAYELGKEYLTKYGAVEDKYNKFIKTWVAKYEKALLDYNFRLSASQKKTADAFRYGKEILSAEPDRLDVLILLGWTAAQDTSDAFDAEAKTYALKAIKLIEAGKQPETKDKTGAVVADWLQFGNREDALGAMNYAVGSFAYRANKPDESATFFYAAVSRKNVFAKDLSALANLAISYEYADYKKAYDEYKDLVSKSPGGQATAETKAALEKALKALDLVIDAYARAVALANDPAMASKKDELMKKLTAYYKSRYNNSDAGLKELIDKVLSRPPRRTALFNTRLI
jgi:hypothetical protein